MLDADADAASELQAQATPTLAPLLIYSDTHTAAAAGCYGSLIAHTPNLDRLAAEGVLFERAVGTVGAVDSVL